MKILKFVTICAMIIMIQSCNSQKKESKKEEQKQESKNSNQVSFDLINIKLSEKIADLLKVVNMSFKNNEETDALTLFTNKKFESTSSKFLRFDNILLNGKDDNQVNNVIFHYGEDSGIVGMYQLNIFSKAEIDNLTGKLNINLGKTIFQTQKSGNVSDIINGEMKESKVKFDEKIFIWSKKDLIYYFFVQVTYDKKIKYKSNLFVIKKQKTWIDFIGSLGFQDINQSLKN